MTGTRFGTHTKDGARMERDERDDEFFAAIDFLRSAIAISDQNPTCSRWNGPDFSSVSLDLDFIHRDIEAALERRDYHDLFALGVMYGAAAQYRFQKIVERIVEKREEPLLNGRTRAHDSREAQEQANELIRHSWKEIRPHYPLTRGDSATGHRIKKLLKDRGLAQLSVRQIIRIAKGVTTDPCHDCF
jgi:hypothetical protein